MIKTYRKTKRSSGQAGVQSPYNRVGWMRLVYDVWGAVIERKVLVFSLLFLLVTLPIFLLVTKYKSKVEAAWMDDAWSYRKAVAIPSHTSLETNVYVTVPTFDATDTSKFQADCGDLRFTKQNGEQLPYYVVDCDATANIHVQFDSLPAGASNYYMYYGNPSVQNGFSSADFATAATGLGTQVLASEEKSAGPVAYWKFDEGYGTVANNSTSNTTLTGSISGPTWANDDQCINGKCLNYSATAVQSTAISNNITAGWATNNDFTLSMWFNCKGEGYSGNGGSQYNYLAGLFIHGTSAEGGTGGFFLRQTSTTCGSVQFLVGTTTSSNNITTSLSSGQNNWSHLVVSKSGDALSLYENGILKNSQTFAGASWYVNPALESRIGSVHSRSIKGYIDDVKIYNYARTAAQIKSDFASKGSGSVKGTAASLGSSAKNSDAFSNGLVGYWKMDEASWTNDCTATSVTDSSGNGNNGSSCPNGTGPTGGNLGKFGNGGTLNGTSQYLTSTLSTSLQPTRATLALWWKADSTGAYQYVIDTNSDSALYGYTIQVNPGLTGYYVTFGNVGQDKFTSYTFTAGTWYHISTTYDGSNIVTFINGSQQSSFAISSSPNITYSGGALNIGRSNNNSLFAKGTIDETRIYNRALSPKEVRDLYAWAPGPVGYWNFEEGTGGTVNDTSGNSGTGTWYGTGNHWTQGKFGKSGQFNSTDNYVNVGSGSPLQLSKTGTVCLWFKPLTAFSGSTGAQKHLMGGGPRDFYFSGSSSILYYFLSDDATGIGSNAGSWDTNWHYVCTTSDGTTLKMYIDGVQQTSTVALGANNYFGNLSAVTIGKSANSFTGNIDDVKIYNYARTSGQIIEDMNAGHPLGGSPVGSQVGYWKFDEGYGITANNSGNIGSALNGTLTSSPSWSNSGKFGKALSFNGAGSYVDAGNDSSANLTNQLTITAWINPTVNDSIRTVVARHTGTNGYAFQLRNLVEAGRLTFYANGTTSTGNTVVPTGQWSYVAVTYDSSTTTVKFYLNGKLDGSNTSAGTILSQTQSLSIGRLRPADTIQAFNGLIDEVKIYNAALTEDEIKLDYNRGSAMVLGSTSTTSAGVPDNSSTGEYCVPGSSDSCSAPVGEWKMEEKTGVSAYDTSGNGNTGTLTNSPSWSLGKIGSAISFDADSEHVDMGAAKFDTLTNATVEMWFYYTGSFDANRLLFYRYKDGSNRQPIFISYSGGHGNKLVFENLVGGSNRAITSNDVVSTNTWYHAAFICGTGGMKMYLNGVQQTSTNATTDCFSSIAATVNNKIGWTSSTLMGKIDQVKIYNYARTPAQIAWDYNRGAPVGHWKFDECQGITANDSSGNGNSGTITIGATGTNTSAGTCTGSAGEAWKDGAIGKYNSSLEFDGTDDYVSVPTSTAINHTTNGTFSIGIWVKPDTLTSSWRRGIIVQESYLNSGYRLGFDNGGAPRFWTDQSGGTLTMLSSTAMTISQWNHILVTYNNQQAYLYLNGIQVGSSTGTYIAGTNAFNVGAAVSEYFSGQIDDVRIFNYALTANQVKTLYNAGAAVQFAPLTGTP